MGQKQGGSGTVSVMDDVALQYGRDVVYHGGIGFSQNFFESGSTTDISYEDYSSAGNGVIQKVVTEFLQGYGRAMYSTLGLVCQNTQATNNAYNYAYKALGPYQVSDYGAVCSNCNGNAVCSKCNGNERVYTYLGRAFEQVGPGSTLDIWKLNNIWNSIRMFMTLAYKALEECNMVPIHGRSQKYKWDFSVPIPGAYYNPALTAKEGRFSYQGVKQSTTTGAIAGVVKYCGVDLTSPSANPNACGWQLGALTWRLLVTEARSDV
jgi:hypothetical protein